MRGYLPLDPNVAPTAQLVAANQALKLQELALHKQELLFELQGYQVNRVAGETSKQDLFAVNEGLALTAATFWNTSKNAHTHTCCSSTSTCETSRQLDRSSPCDSMACFDCCCVKKQHSAHQRTHTDVAALQSCERQDLANCSVCHDCICND